MSWRLIPPKRRPPPQLLVSGMTTLDDLFWLQDLLAGPLSSSKIILEVWAGLILMASIIITMMTSSIDSSAVYARSSGLGDLQAVWGLTTVATTIISDHVLQFWCACYGSILWSATSWPSGVKSLTWNNSMSSPDSMPRGF